MSANTAIKSKGGKTRRTQAERTLATRTRLLDAAVESLIAVGYAGTTTTRVAERAGVSRGAQLHHFPTKISLVTSAVRHLAERRIALVRLEAQQLPEGGNRVSQVTELVWSTFSGPLFQAAVELWIAGRTDEKLHAALRPIESRIGRAIYELCEDLYGAAGKNSKFKTLIRMTMYLMRGMALERILNRDEGRYRDALRLWESMMEESLRWEERSSLSASE